MKSAANVFWERFLHSYVKLLINEDFIFCHSRFLTLLFQKYD